MQRFGTSFIPTHAVGLAILRQDYALAVDLLLRPRPGEHPDAEAGRMVWRATGDAERALGIMPKRCVAERSLLEAFRREGEIEEGTERDWYKALSNVSSNRKITHYCLFSVLYEKRI